MGKKWPKNGEKMGFGVIFLFFRNFWAIFCPFRAEGHFLFFGQFFHFWILARFPFYTRRPDSQLLARSSLCWGMSKAPEPLPSQKIWRKITPVKIVKEA